MSDPIITIVTLGVFTKHAHPSDCRQYYLCIGGIPREYGCPLGSVFSVGSGNGEDGECTEPELVPECSDYYADTDISDSLLDQGFSPRHNQVNMVLYRLVGVGWLITVYLALAQISMKMQFSTLKKSQLDWRMRFHVFDTKK